MKEKAVQSLLSLFRLWLHLYPASFRAEFDEEMTAVFAQQVRAAASEGALNLLLLCGREFAALTVEGLAQRIHEEPALLAQAIGGDALVSAGRRLRARILPVLPLALIASCGLLTITAVRNVWYVTYDETFDVRHVALADLTGDGHLDAILSVGSLGDGFWRSDRLLLNDGSGRFTDSGQELGEWRSFTASTGDVDGDRDVDVIIASYVGLKQYENDGNGRFEERHYDVSMLINGSWTINAALADLDGDGTLDAFVTACCGFIVTPNPRNYPAGSAPGPQIRYPYSEAWLNDGAGTLVNTGQRIGRAGSNAVALGDLNGDGAVDAFLANGQTLVGDDGQYEKDKFNLLRSLSCPISQNTFGIAYSYKTPNTVWFNDGQGAFADSNQQLGRSESIAVALGELNDDGFLDAVVGNCGPDEIWLNDGRGHFSAGGQRLGRGLTWSVHLADIDADGDLDLFTGGETSGRMWLNDSAGRFRRGQRIRYGRYDAVALGDVDGDGLTDILAAGVDSYRVWHGQGNGRFSANGRDDYR